MIVKGSAAKRHRQNLKRRLSNRMVRSTVKTSIKQFISAAQGNDKEKAETTYKAFTVEIDKAVTKGVYHRNSAARKKSRMYKLLHKVGA